MKGFGANLVQEEIRIDSPLESSPMAEPVRCSNCKQELPTNALMGLCPLCLLAGDGCRDAQPAASRRTRADGSLERGPFALERFGSFQERNRRGSQRPALRHRGGAGVPRWSGRRRRGCRRTGATTSSWARSATAAWGHVLPAAATPTWKRPRCQDPTQKEHQDDPDLRQQVHRRGADWWPAPASGHRARL